MNQMDNIRKHIEEIEELKHVLTDCFDDFTAIDRYVGIVGATDYQLDLVQGIMNTLDHKIKHWEHLKELLYEGDLNND